MLKIIQRDFSRNSPFVDQLSKSEGPIATGTTSAVDIDPRGNSPSAPTIHSLHYGHSRAPLARVVADDYWPSMWRIVWPDGRRSDLVNLDRAKDAAAAIAERGPPARNRRLLHWKKNPSKRASEAHRSRGAQIPTGSLEVAE